MLSIFRRPFGSPNAVIYSYELSKFFLDNNAASILEVGCGIGIYAFRAASFQKRTFIMAVDQSEKTIDYMRSNYGKYYPNLQLSSCDFCEKDLSLGRVFDQLYTSDVIEHVTDVKTFVENIHQHLCEGGKAVINFPNESNHGINHFNQVADVKALFAAFSEVKVFLINIEHPVAQLWISVRAFYEKVFSPSTRQTRDHLYSEREQQGIDCFDESTCFNFVQGGRLRNAMASMLAEIFLLIKPTVTIRQIEDGYILNQPRIVAVAVR